MLNNHTNPPTLMVRLASAVIDFAIFAILFFISTYVIFDPIFTPGNDKSSKYYQEMMTQNEALVYSGLFVKKDKNYVQLNNGTIDEYRTIVENYYTTDKYFGSEWYIAKGGERKPYTIEQYNSDILFIGQDETIFEYDLTNDKIDKTKIGVYKSSLYIDKDNTKGLSEEGKEKIKTFYVNQYRICFSNLFEDDFYKNASKYVRDQGTYQIVCGLALSTTITYLLVPLINKKHYTLGRLCMRIGISNHHGFEPKTYQIAARFLPTLLLSLVPLITNDAFVIFPIWGGYLFLSMCTTIILAEKTSLPDLISFTRCIDLKTSTIYKDEYEMTRDEDELYNY